MPENEGALPAALAYAERGWSVFPLTPGSKKPRAGSRGLHDATNDPAVIKEWWDLSPDSNVGVRTGRVSGVVVLDVDGDEGAAALADLEQKHEPLPPTLSVKTPRGGQHYYFAHPGEEIKNTVGCPAREIDFRGDGGFVVAPPSIVNGKGYEIGDGLPVADAPGWLITAIRNRQLTEVRAEAVQGNIPAHQRNNTLTSLAGTMRRRGFSGGAIEAALLVENGARCKPPLPDREVRSIAASVGRYEPTAEAMASVEALSQLLGLDAVGKRIDNVRVFGRGGRSHVYLHLDDGDQIVLDPFSSVATATKLTFEIASQAGATPELTAPRVARAAALIYALADHHHEADVADRAFEFGAEYLRSAAHGEFVSSDQASRWETFAKLDAHDPRGSHIVLVDTESGDRFVRAQWFADHLRERTGPGEPDQITHALERSGWRKPGREGKIKATRPGLPGTLTWAFFVVTAGWEDQ